MGFLKVGDQAPDFTLKSHLEEMVCLSDVLAEGKSAILYFYSANSSPICITEACAFRDSYKLFKDVGIEIIGISANSITSHMNFAEKLKIPYTLLSDRDRKVAEEYGVNKILGLVAERATFIISTDGIIKHTFTDQLNGKAHADFALKFLDVRI